jgi:hypothetical protein
LREVAWVTAQRAFPPAPKNPRPLILRQEAIDRGLNKYRLNEAVLAGRIRVYRPGGWIMYDGLEVDTEIEALKKQLR